MAAHYYVLYFLCRYSSRVNYDVACAMDFHRYPVDEQICEIKFESFGYTSKQVCKYFVSILNVLDWTQGTGWTPVINHSQSSTALSNITRYSVMCVFF